MVDVMGIVNPVFVIPLEGEFREEWSIGRALLEPKRVVRIV